MSSLLPRHPSIDHLKKQAKMLLAAQKNGAPASCALFRKIRRFATLSDQEVLQHTASLSEAQLALALHYGFSGWKEMMDEVRSHPPDTEFSLRGIRERSEEDIPEYAGAGVPLAVTAAMNHAGIPIGFMEFAAASGWAFSFGYRYESDSPAHMAVCGQPGRDGPFEVFAFLPGLYGLAYEMAPTADPDRVWAFVKDRVETGIPVMSEQLDGGLISSTREKGERRQLFFDGTVAPGWIDVDHLQPHAVYAFIRRGEELSQAEITRAALARALLKGRPHEWEGIPQGKAALLEYHSDVSDPSRDFEECPEWFCWAAFQRLLARRCSEVWLRSVARAQTSQAQMALTRAADGYGRAYRHYEQYLREIRKSMGDRPPRSERARSPERILAIAPHLEQGIREEESGLKAIEEALALLE